MGENAQAMSDSAVKAIQQSVETQTIEVDGQQFTTRTVYDPPSQKHVETLAIATLTGLVEFVKSQLLKLPLEEGEGIIVQVEGSNSAAVKGPIWEGRFRERDVFARAIANNPLKDGFRFGTYYALEDFNIHLRTLFTDSGSRDSIVALLGNVKGNKVAEGEDDGFSQKVTVLKGVVKMEEKGIQNPVSLHPYRTFSEIVPFNSNFILRLKADPDGEDPPTVALFESDGGEWEQRAIKEIVTYLKGELPDQVIIG